MEHSMTFRKASGGEIGVRFDTPKVCPCCNHAIEPSVIFGYETTTNDLSVMYYCRHCSSAFVTLYKKAGTRTNSAYDLVIVKSYPKSINKREFDNSISDLSESFVEIYNQAKEAEDLGLDHICGMAYRKALEFLIKDFAINQNSDDESIIADPKYPLSKCINDYIKEDDLKNTAKASVWIGNDYSHYTRQHEDKTIDDLKSFIDAVLYFIMYKLKADEAKSFTSQT